MIKAEIIFNRLISSAFEKKASEIILFPSEKPFLRKDGKIEPLVNEEIITTSFINEILDFLLNQEQKERFDKEKQIIFSKDLTDEQRAKIIVLKQKNLLSLSIKLISNKITPLENLKLPNVVKDLASLNSGLLIISGPRDSGRSSLLASIIDYRNRNFVEYISTLENPIEFLFKGNKCLIEQRELNKDVLSFKDGIHLIKNRNVDVFAISEIENLEMIFDLFEICQKGVFVIVILGINSVFNVVKQIIESFEPEKQNLIKLLLGENLAGIICTRLIPRVGGGRILALEILNGSPAAKAIIKEGKLYQLNNLLQVAEKELSVSLDRFLANLVLSGEITINEASKYCLDKDYLLSLIRR